MHTEGKNIKDANGNIVYLRGVNKMGLEYNNPAVNPWRSTSPAYYSYDANQIASWGVNYVKLPFNGGWYEKDANYRKLVKSMVANLTSRNIYVTLILQEILDSSGSPVRLPDQIETDASANATFAYCVKVLKNVTVDFKDNPKMVGIGIDEYSPFSSPSKSWIWLINKYNGLTKEVHAINPNLLVLYDLEEYVYDYVDSATLQSGANIPLEPNAVFDMHFFGGSSTLASRANTKVKYLQNLYDVPYMIGGWGVYRTEASTVIPDFLRVVNTNNWSQAYWVYAGIDNDEMQLLYDDNGAWNRLTPQGVAFTANLKTIGG